jgi:hypothetical protein
LPGDTDSNAVGGSNRPYSAAGKGLSLYTSAKLEGSNWIVIVKGVLARDPPPNTPTLSTWLYPADAGATTPVNVAVIVLAAAETANENHCCPN